MTAFKCSWLTVYGLEKKKWNFSYHYSDCCDERLVQANGLVYKINVYKSDNCDDFFFSFLLIKQIVLQQTPRYRSPQISERSPLVRTGRGVRNLEKWGFFFFFLLKLRFVYIRQVAILNPGVGNHRTLRSIIGPRCSAYDSFASSVFYRFF